MIRHMVTVELVGARAPLQLHWPTSVSKSQLDHLAQLLENADEVKHAFLDYKSLAEIRAHEEAAVKK